MHFSTSALALTVIAFASALPATIPLYPLPTTLGYTSPPNYNLLYSLPIKLVDLSKGLKEASIIRLTFTSLYDVWTSTMHYDKSNSKIFKDGRTTDVTTLLTFDFLPKSEGKMYSFHFESSSNTTMKVSSTGQFDIFISLAPTTHDTTTWPLGNLRD